MEVVESCITDTSIVSTPSEKDVCLNHYSKIEENKVSDFVVETSTKVISEPVVDNLQRKSGERGIKLFSDCDDSFEVFLPLKKSSSQKSNESFKQQSGKQKLKKNTRTRACPYFSTKNAKSNFKSPLKSQEDKDLELALARSLLDVGGCSEVQEKNSDNSVITVCDSKKENPLKLKNWTSKKDQKKNLKSLLTRRTSQDRERIITQKLAIVLLECKKLENLSSYNRGIELHSSVLGELLDKNSTLWELSKINDIGLNSFYVGALSNFIEPIQTPIIDCEMAHPNETVKGSTKNTSGPQIEPVVPDNEDTSDIIDLDDEEEISSSPNFGTKLDSLKLFSDDWSKVIGIDDFSDVDVLLPSGIFPCHKLVLKARCPEILKDVICLYKPHAIDLSHYPAKSTEAFLKYIYAGRTDDISHLSTDEKRFLTALARKYKLEYLCSLINCSERDSFYNQSTCSAPNNSPQRIQDSSTVKNRRVSCDSSKNKKVLNNNFTENEHFILDEPPIVLMDSSSSSEGKYFSQINKYEKKSPKDSRPFKAFSKKSISPDLFDNSSLNVSGTSSQIKRKLSFEHDFKRKHSQSPSHDSQNISQDIEKSPFKYEIVTLDSSPDNTRSPEAKNTPERKLRLQKIPSSSVNDISLKEDDLCDSNFHFNFDINDHYEPDKYQDKQSEENKSDLLSNSGCDSPPIPLDEDTADKDSSSKAKKSSLEKYLHTSFPSFTEDIIDAETINKNVRTSTPTSTPRPSASNEVTSSPEQEVIIRDATPQANYSRMASPELQIELSKYGLKPTLGRKKGQALLRYIQEQTLIETPLNSKRLERGSGIPSRKEMR